MSLIQQNCKSILSIRNTLPAINEIFISRNYSSHLKTFYNFTPLNFKKLSFKTITLEKLNSSTNIKTLNQQFKSQQQRLYATRSKKNCWKCNAENKIEAIFCENEKCKVIQFLDPEVDYFDIFGIKKEFDIDLKSLKIKFLKLQQSVHPDNFSTKSDKEKQYSELQSSFINKAYHVLLKPLDRALYILEINGYTIEEHNNIKDTQFLMNIMEINESIDDAEDQDDIDDINEENQERIKNSIDLISKDFKSGKWEEMKEEAIKLRYWTNIQNTLKEWNPKKK
ncbi:Co-chaperone Hsc20 [Neocallimastix lanati (nom. inval.)]|jgi:molecular chaperone HscB|nr:Co-chaperone Hsc20 [Neocallimastix sp. JGI-2020a]